MKLTVNQIDWLAFQVLKALQGQGQIKCEDFDAAQDHVARAITADLQVEDKLNEEVRTLLAQHEHTIRREGAQYHEMFKMLKAKLVRERKLIL